MPKSETKEKKSARALWKGIIKFDGKKIPVKLYTSVRAERTRFNLLHDKDNVRLQQQLTCSLENTPVPNEEIVKGYPVSPGEYVILDPNEIDAMEPTGGRDMEIKEFVEFEAMDPRYVERTYYLGPDGDNESFATLAKALEKTQLAGMCQWVMRNRSYVGALMLRSDVVCVAILRYADELIPTENLEIKRSKITPKELKTAISLIDALTVDFEPQKFRNEYEERVRLLIKRKSKGEKVTLKKPKRPETTAADGLLETLEASVMRAHAKERVH